MRLKIDKIQFIWWWDWPAYQWWAYPRDFKMHKVYKGKPIFWGLYLGIVEIRFFPIR